MKVGREEKWKIQKNMPKNWIVQMQGFLINCATYGFTSNYEKIMDGEYGYDLFHGTYGEN